MATAAWIAAAALSTGGVTALVLKKAAGAKAAGHLSITPSTKEDHHG
jgi:hypothetical protein